MKQEPVPSEAPGLRAIRTMVLVLLAVGFLMFVSTIVQKKASFSPAAWVMAGVGAIVVTLVYTRASAHPACRVGTREVVMMAIGAALYGILATSTNWLLLSPVSPVSLRPAIAIPVLFGALFGPVVGFFTGAVGNILGDFISGYGVYPAWDVGNGLVGLIAGMVPVYGSEDRAINAATAVAATVAAGMALLLGISRSLVFENPLSGRQINHHSWWWVMALSAGVLLAVRFAFRGRKDVLAPVIWGTLGVILGLGFAAVADIWINGYTPVVALAGEFAPAAGPDILMIVILVPMLYSAYTAAVRRSGR